MLETEKGFEVLFRRPPFVCPDWTSNPEVTDTRQTPDRD
jgi:hypothetical protein